MIPPPPRSTLFPTRRSSDLTLPSDVRLSTTAFPEQFSKNDPVAAGRCRSIIAHVAQMVKSFICATNSIRSEEHTSELQSQFHLVCRLLLEKKKITNIKLLTR